MKNWVFILFACFIMYSSSIAQETDQSQVIQSIRKHGLENSQVMDIASWLTDVHGPRLTGSPMLNKASAWSMEKLKEFGLKNVHLDEWGPFGRGWQLEMFHIHATSPSYFPLIAYPKAWSPSVQGKGEVIFFDPKNEEDLNKYKGKLTGKFVMIDDIREVSEWFTAPAARYESEELLRMANAAAPTPRPRRQGGFGSFSFNQAMWKFIEEEKPLAVLDRSFKGDLGTVFVSGARSAEGRPQEVGKSIVPQVTVSVEHYNRIIRLMQKNIPVELHIDLSASFIEEDQMQYNVIGEIPGTDLSDEVVMFGAHIDSWHTGTGATDNAAGSSVMMEAARILMETIKESGIQPRRTLRIALWSGEEQGLFGSRNYVGKHFAEFGEGGWTPQSIKPAQSKISAYYNLDNGTGKIRGIYMQGNEKVAPIFRKWFEPFKDLEAGTLTLSNTGGTDHLPFDGVGIPGFQFIQDPIAYFNRTHHSNMDNYDHLIEDDLKQAATIIAAFVWNTAMMDEKLPRKPLDLDLRSGTN
ncbi:MAG TPA: M28 family peptidase [Saprospiraceae bacterium]|nr:M28 family peptidase [Saprospiraceae bacterium]